MAPDGGFSTLHRRRALEALRNGVPNSDAVAILGCEQPGIERGFRKLLSHVTGTADSPGIGGGMLVSGDFGSGKSHLLAHLEHGALEQGFVCSKVAISKETPLYDLGKVFRAAMENSRIPGGRGRLIEELGQKLDPRSASYRDFFAWADSTTTNGLSKMFPATLLIHERSDDPELNRAIENYWAGDPLGKARVTGGLREIGRLADYSFKAPRLSELHPQRLRFMSRLIRAAGFTGWVVLLDEIELVSQYSILQRARSYAELPRWFGRAPGGSPEGLVAVATVTDDFALEIISPQGNKKDRDYASAKLANRYPHLIAPAEAGMNILEREAVPLEEQSEEQAAEALENLRALYGSAYGIDAPSLPRPPRGAGYQNRMRYRVRASINEWDLRRLYPDHTPEIVEEEFRYSYEEDVEADPGATDSDGTGDNGSDGPAE
jgi:hypothetical protein